MKQLITIVVVAVLGITNLFANDKLTDANVSGHVISAETGEHLPYMNITLEGTTQGTVTDATGHFLLKNLPIGDYKIKAYGMGYASQTIDVTTAKDKTTDVSFKLNEDAMMLEQVVVTGNKNEIIRTNSSTLISVIPNTMFEMVSAASLADGLDFQTGVRVENDCQNCGFTQVRINGLEGAYSQILMDSRPVYSALTGVYGLEQIPASMIERVEVLRGGGSALFGSSAVGGTINIITKDPVYNSAEIAHTSTSIGGTDAWDNNSTFNASVVSDNQKAGIFIYGQNRERAAYDANGDNISEIPMLNTQALGMRSFFKTSDNSKLTLQYHKTHEFRRGGEMDFDLQPHQVSLTEQVEHYINGGGLNFDLYSDDYKNKFNVYASFQNTDRASYYGAEYDEDAYGTTDDLVVVSGAQYIHNWDNLWFMPAEFLAGVEYNYNHLIDEAQGYDHYAEQKVNIYSAFLQNEWRTDKFGFLIGARLDKHSLIDNVIVSPRANIRYNPNKNMNYRLTYSTGFRAPQAFDEDYHIALVGGERVVTVLADDLTQEKSKSVSLSGDYYYTIGGVQTNFLIEGFYTHLDDTFTTVSLEEQDEYGNDVQERQNGEGATVMGISLEAKAAFSRKLQAQVGFTIQSSKYDSAQEWSETAEWEESMLRTPNLYGYFTINYTPIKPLTLSLTGTYTGEMLAPHYEGSGTDEDVLITTPDFMDVNFKVSYDFTIYNYVKLQLNAGVNNIFNAYQSDFDSGIERDAGYMYGPMMPRSIFIGAKINI